MKETVEDCRGSSKNLAVSFKYMHDKCIGVKSVIQVFMSILFAYSQQWY